MKKFRDGTDSEKLEIINAMINGDPVEGLYDEFEGQWVVLAVARGVNFDTAYRIPKRPMSIDWDVLKDEYICAARDRDGNPYAYVNAPDKSEDCGHWIAEDYYICIYHLKSYDPGTVEWDESLIWKPGHEPKGE